MKVLPDDWRCLNPYLDSNDIYNDCLLLALIRESINHAILVFVFVFSLLSVVSGGLTLRFLNFSCLFYPVLLDLGLSLQLWNHLSVFVNHIRFWFLAEVSFWLKLFRQILKIHWTFLWDHTLTVWIETHVEFRRGRVRVRKLFIKASVEALIAVILHDIESELYWAIRDVADSWLRYVFEGVPPHVVYSLELLFFNKIHLWSCKLCKFVFIFK